MDYNSLIASYNDRQNSIMQAQDNMRMKFDDFIGERDALKGARDQAGAMIAQGVIPVIEQASKLYTLTKQLKGVKALGGMLENSDTLRDIKGWFGRKLGMAQETASNLVEEGRQALTQGQQALTEATTAGQQALTEATTAGQQALTEATTAGQQALTEATTQARAAIPAISEQLPELPDLPGLSDIPRLNVPSLTSELPTIPEISMSDPAETALGRALGEGFSVSDTPAGRFAAGLAAQRPEVASILSAERPSLRAMLSSGQEALTQELAAKSPIGSQSSYTFGLFKSSRPAKSILRVAGGDEEEFPGETITRPGVQYFVRGARAIAGQQEDLPETPGFLSRIFGKRAVPQLSSETEELATPEVPSVSTLTNLVRANVPGAAQLEETATTAIRQIPEAAENLATAGRSVGSAVSQVISGDAPPSSLIRNISTAGSNLVDSLPDEWVSAIKSVLPDTAGEALGTGLAIAGEAVALTEGIMQIKESFKQAADIDKENTDLDAEASQMMNHPIFSWGKQALDNTDTTQGQPVMSHF